MKDRSENDKRQQRFFEVRTEPFEDAGSWYIERDCPLCLRLTIHKLDSSKTIAVCLRCTRITQEARQDAAVRASLIRLGLLEENTDNIHPF